jgi:hypothetical protein
MFWPSVICVVIILAALFVVYCFCQKNVKAPVKEIPQEVREHREELARETLKAK